MIDGIDISDYQDGIENHFGSIKKAGVAFVYAKATDGPYFKSDTFGKFRLAADDVNILFGAYHFFRFGQDPVAQANHFLAVANPTKGELTPMVDVEGDSGAFDVGALAAFNGAVEKQLGRRVVIYTGLAYWNNEAKGTDAFSGHPLWIAEYNSDAEPELPQGWKDWSIWQYSSTGQLGTYPGALDLDKAKEVQSLVL